VSRQQAGTIQGWGFYAPDPRFPVFSKYDIKQGVDFERNTNCWGYALDLTPFSPWHKFDKERRAGALITPKHFANAAHYVIDHSGYSNGPHPLHTPTNDVGREIVFVSQDNEVIRRKIVSSTHLKNKEGVYIKSISQIDIRVYELDEPVPDSISVCKFLPKNTHEYLPNGLINSLAVCLNKREELLPMLMSTTGVFAPQAGDASMSTFKQIGKYPPIEWSGLFPGSEETALQVVAPYNLDPDEVLNDPRYKGDWENLLYWNGAFSEEQLIAYGKEPPPVKRTWNYGMGSLCDGDSGGPIFTYFPNEPSPVILSFFRGTTYGPSATWVVDEINACIEFLSPGEGYEVEFVDLSIYDAEGFRGAENPVIYQQAMRALIDSKFY
jgi:hypothetical protein